MNLPEFNLFSDKSARIFLIFPCICPNFHGFPNVPWFPPPAPCLVRLCFPHIEIRISEFRVPMGLENCGKNFEPLES